MDLQSQVQISPAAGYYVPTPTQPAIPTGSVNEPTGYEGPVRLIGAVVYLSCCPGDVARIVKIVSGVGVA